MKKNFEILGSARFWNFRIFQRIPRYIFAYPWEDLSTLKNSGLFLEKCCYLFDSMAGAAIPDPSGPDGRTDATRLTLTGAAMLSAKIAGGALPGGLNPRRFNGGSAPGGALMR